MKEQEKKKKVRARESSFYSKDKKQEEIIRLAKQIKSENSSYFYGLLSTGAGSG